MRRTEQLTVHFKLSEFIRAGDPLPDGEIIYNLQRLAERLQVIRDLLGVAIHINSGYRSPTYNAAIGGKPDSYHLKGMAADIEAEGIPPRTLQHYLANWSGGMGCYETFTHLDIRPRKTRW